MGKFIITEEERKRILELYEQKTTYTFSEESKSARAFIFKEFNLGYNNPNWSGMTAQQQISEFDRAKRELQNMDKDELVRKSISAGVSPESVKALQNDLKTVSGRENLSFYSDGVKKDFTDGKLGTNTASAWIDYQKYLSSLPKDDDNQYTSKPIQKGSAKDAVRTSYNVGK